jgi:SAM-dependent methyltransferase
VTAPTAAANVSEEDGEALARYLLSFDWAYRNDTVHQILVAGGLPLWRQILRFVPNPKERGKALELGSPPFHITLLLQKFRNYDLSLTGFAADGRPEIEQSVESSAYGERYTFRCQCFDAEKERFPYPDNSFDLVTWCEVIEHLTENPVHTLAEIHRVLKPGGALVLSTPNASRADSIANFLAGRNIYDPYHLGAPLKGSRHSREYTLPELKDLIEGCGYSIDRAEDIDIYGTPSRSRKAFRWVMNSLIAQATRGHYRYHLFVRARKTSEPFRWRFPDALFDGGHLAFYESPRDPAVVFGQNDTIHTSMGWGPLRQAGGREYRRSGDVGDIYLVSQKSVTKATITCRGGAGQAQIWHDREGQLAWIGDIAFVAPPGEWTEVEVPISNEHVPGSVVHVRLDVPGGVDVARAEIS